MLKAEDVPDECFDAAMAVVVKDGLRAAIAAALNAWPEMSARPTFGPSRIILPLPEDPQERIAKQEEVRDDA